ncbi:universal stress protein [Halobacteriales archaeon QS_4_70_19]|nr:MAG: universal stress protein [Halobacteriales archaeon QS_4_70_19]
MGRSLTAYSTIPVANEDDARATVKALEEYSHAKVTLVHVVEKAGGAPDKLSLERVEGLADESFAAFREIVPDVETELVYDESVVQAISDLAVAVDASAIAFRPRGCSRLVQLLAGDRASRLVTESELPVLALTNTDGEGS